MIDDEVVIHIKEDKSVRLEITENGKTCTKLISPQTLFDCIKGSLSSTPVKIASGLLPSNIISVTGDETGARYAVVEYAYETADITYMTTEYKKFPLPRFIFGFKVESSGRISEVKLGVPALGKLEPDTKMYYYPFSNVSYFSLCTGTNTLPNIKSLKSLENLPGYIISLPDNDDHYLEKHNKLNLGHRDLLEHLKDKDRQYYYDKVLIQMPNATLKNFL